MFCVPRFERSVSKTYNLNHIIFVHSSTDFMQLQCKCQDSKCRDHEFFFHHLEDL